MTVLHNEQPYSGFVGKFKNYEKALMKLQEVIEIVRLEPENDFYRDSLLQRYEFTWELAWKTLKEYMQEMGFTFDLSPMATLKQAFQQNLIDDEKDWLASVRGRNLLAHTYDEGTANTVANDVITKYNKGFMDLYEKLNTIYKRDYDGK
jgi:nucleotidyltransferase substrate binding protein (TIGR01987 family)